jgi:hypothetical protein
MELAGQVVADAPDAQAAPGGGRRSTTRRPQHHLRLADTISHLRHKKTFR